MKEKLEPNNTEHNDRFLEVTNMILEKVKTTKHSRIRSESGQRLRSESETDQRRICFMIDLAVVLDSRVDSP